MGYNNILPLVNPYAIEERRRNWLLRTRFGPQWLSKSLKDRIYQGLHVQGKNLNHFARLPAITASEIQNAQKNHLGPFTSPRSFHQASKIGHSLDDIHLNNSTIPLCATGPEHHDNVVDGFKRRPSSYGGDIRPPRTVPEWLGHRRWSDVERKDLLEDSIQNLSSGLNLKNSKEKETIAKYKEEFIRPRDPNDAGKNTPNYGVLTRKLPSFVTMKMGMKNGLTAIPAPQMLDSSRYPSSPTKEYEKFVELQQINENRHNGVKRGRIETRKNGNKENALKVRKQSMLIPSGDSSHSTTGVNRTPSNSTAVNRTSSNTVSINRTSSNSNTKTNSSTKAPLRRSSRTLHRDNSKSRKSDMSMKTRKSISKPDSPPRPSEEELQELELPVIRKFLKMPPSRPKVICFDYPGVDLTHMDVKRAIEKVIPDAFETGKVISLQFENVNVKLATGGLNNRWYIELRDFTTRNLLIKKGLSPEVSNKSTSCVELTQKPSTEAGTSSEAELQPVKITYPKSVQVKLYDTLSMEEYKLYLRRTAAEEKLQNVILLCAGRGDKLLSTML